MSVLNELYSVVTDRREHPQEKSYTCYLFNEGLDKICKKCGEECTEMVIAAKNNDNNELKNEIADLLYHVTVLCAQQGLDIADVEEELRQRSRKIGNLKEFHVSDHNT